MEHTSENNLIQCRFCSWRANERFELPAKNVELSTTLISQPHRGARYMKTRIGMKVPN